jgi:hypothetical protein
MLLLLDTLAECKLSEGGVDDAEQLVLISNEFYREHPGYTFQKAWAEADLGRIKRVRGLWAEAEKLLQSALPTLEHRFGREHFRVQRLLKDLADAQASLKKASTETY